MSRQKNITTLLWLATLQMTLACSNDAKFAGKGSLKSEDFAKKILAEEPVEPTPAPTPLPTEPTPPPTEEPDGSFSQNFTSSPVLGLVDIAWVVDQSLSMTEEIANVRTNLLSFINAIDAKFDANHALIASPTKSEREYSLSLPIVDAKHRQFSYPVESNDALQILIGSFMDKKIEMFRYQELREKYTDRYPKQLQGVLKDFFRPNAKPIVVVVTDDNAFGVTEDNFERLSKTYLGKVPTLYAFRGIKQGNRQPNCDISEDGEAYDRIAKNTGGDTFDICEKDWSKNFSKLTKGISTSLKNTFATEHPIERILSIEVNGAKIPYTQYSFTGNKVSVLSEAFPINQKSNVVVNYQRSY
jgi:hypothetical protein